MKPLRLWEVDGKQVHCAGYPKVKGVPIEEAIEVASGLVYRRVRRDADGRFVVEVQP